MPAEISTRDNPSLTPALHALGSAVSGAPENAPAPPETTADDKPGGPRIDPIGSIRKHPLFAIAVFVLIAILGAPLAWIKGKSTYSTSAVIFVSPKFLANLQDDKEFELQSNSQYREYVQQN